MSIDRIDLTDDVTEAVRKAYPMNTRCARCDRTWGYHHGHHCPNGSTKFLPVEGEEAAAPTAAPTDEADQQEKSAMSMDHANSIARTGDKITIPAEISLKKAGEIIASQIAYEDTEVALNESIPGFYWDAAHAFYKAACQKFGWVFQQPIPPSFFTPAQPPVLFTIQSGVGETVTIPQGRMTVPNLSGPKGKYFLQTMHRPNEQGQAEFVIAGKVLRKDEPMIRELAELTRKILAESSIYKGKAIRIRFHDDDGDVIPLPQPTFWDVSKHTPEDLILPEQLSRAVETSVFTPIRHAQACRDAGVPLKRGVLLSGPYGTGKSLTAAVAAHLCQKHGFTFIYGQHPSELADYVRLARQYAPAVVFCEDIDREVHGERSVSMDEILNVIDGVDTKHTEIMVVLTSNHVENINRALLRPGRLDAVIEFVPPDAVAAMRLIRLYARGLLDPDADLMPVAVKLQGCIPAVIREAVERAKLSAITLNQGGKNLTITTNALLDAADGMAGQLELLKDKSQPMTGEQMLFEGVQRAIVSAASTDLDKMAKQVQEIRERV